MNREASAFDGHFEPTVFVLGEELDLDPLFPVGARVLRVAPGDLHSEASRVALMVLDARSYPPSVLAHARRSEGFEAVPALLITDDEGDPRLAGVGADDVLTPRFGHADQCRVRSLIELGCLRVALPARLTDGARLAGPPDAASLAFARAEVDRLFALLSQRQTFDQAILDGVDVGIVTTDSRGRVTFVNRCAHEVLQRDGDLAGEDVLDLLALPRGPTSVLARQPERRFTHTLDIGDREIEIDLAVSRAQDARQEHLGFFFIFHDRTPEKQLEMERRRFERLAAMGTMVAGFAHEVRNPMASLRSIAESLNEELCEANVRLPHVDRMLKVLERVERLVRTSLLFGNPSPPRLAPQRPWELLSAAVSSLHARTRPLGEELCLEIEGELPDVFVDEGQIVQALVVLLNNALDATGSPRRVRLRASYGRPSGETRQRRTDPPPPMFVRFDVQDDGPGIPADIVGRIFDPFFTTKAGGTGLGLSIAQQLVTENGGRIEVTSAPGGPTTFSVLVAVATADAPVSRR